MKVITAVIPPFALNNVTSALEAIEGFPGIDIPKARRFVRRRSLQERCALQIYEFKEKVCIEMVIPDEKAQQIVETLVHTTRTSDSGDGKVFEWPVDPDAHTQTGEIDDGPSGVTLTLLMFNDFRVFQLASTTPTPAGRDGKMVLASQADDTEVI